MRVRLSRQFRSGSSNLGGVGAPSPQRHETRPGARGREFRVRFPAMTKRVNWMAVIVGGLRLASGVSFLVAPDAANRLWGDSEDSGPTASLLLRSMGYRDALIGGLLLWSGLRGAPSTAGWFLASGGADAADLIGGIANHDRMTDSAKL